jgi:hypothetical protein
MSPVSEIDTYPSPVHSTTGSAWSGFDRVGYIRRNLLPLPVEGSERGSACHLLPYHSLDVTAVEQAFLEQQLRLRQQLAILAGMDEILSGQWVMLCSPRAQA